MENTNSRKLNKMNMKQITHKNKTTNTISTNNGSKKTWKDSPTFYIVGFKTITMIKRATLWYKLRHVQKGQFNNILSNSSLFVQTLLTQSLKLIPKLTHLRSYCLSLVSTGTDSALNSLHLSLRSFLLNG